MGFNLILKMHTYPTKEVDWSVKPMSLTRGERYPECAPNTRMAQR